ncbi:hypothetical protein LRS10_21850 [Phenylobacterium sp. J426]|uniref:hypothetical protein n=1 Tax=Phenylobacterium sp. J426 TaxID=2898439 RepID=UPI002151D0AA|nr:hypothetical protein [Phenylobacterium sp. J426]MCR5876555.1 hypothetical protein [Phenylobacterium sp. J426]
MPPRRIKRSTFGYLVLLAGAGVAAALYHPSARTAEIDAPLAMPKFRNMELAAAEWAVKRHLQQWDNISFQQARVGRQEGRVSVCGLFSVEAGAPTRFVVTDGRVATDQDQDPAFEAAWAAACG